MSVNATYRIGPAADVSTYEAAVGNDIFAAFAAAHRRWPTEPLFCREHDASVPVPEAALSLN